MLGRGTLRRCSAGTCGSYVSFDDFWRNRATSVDKSMKQASKLTFGVAAARLTSLMLA